MALVSCFDIEEHVTFNDDMSGTIRIELHWDEINELVNDPDNNINHDKDHDLSELILALNKIDGISKSLSLENEELLAGVAFKFKNLTALNAAMNLIYKDHTEGIKHEYFSYSKDELVRHPYPLFQEEQDDEFGRMLMKSVGYKTVYTFPKRIREFENPNALIRKDGKTVVLECTLMDFEKVGVGNKIKIKN